MIQVIVLHLICGGKVTKKIAHMQIYARFFQ